MSTTHALATEVARRLHDTPYGVHPAPGGFDVVVDLADARWWGVLSRSGLTKQFRHEVRVDEADGSYRRTDSSRTVEWRAGVGGVADGAPAPNVTGEWSTQKGWVYERSSQKTIGINDSGRPDLVVDYDFDSTVGQRAIKEAAEGLGLKKAMPGEVKVALAFVGGAVLLAVIILVALLVTLL